MKAVIPEGSPASAGDQHASRWRPGQSGNPEGRRHGSRNRATLMLEQLLEGEAEAIVRSVIEAAKGGDLVAAKLLLDRILPPRRSRPLHVDLPALTRTADMPRMVLAMFQAVTEGDLTPAEAIEMTKILAMVRTATRAAGFGPVIDLRDPDAALDELSDWLPDILEE